jgi:hypothetical protein
VAKTCFDTNIHPYYKIKIPMKTWFTSKMILPKETLGFKETISTCYGQQLSMAF